MSNRYRIAVIPGDGIGREITPVALAVARAALQPEGATLETSEWQDSQIISPPVFTEAAAGLGGAGLAYLDNPPEPAHASVFSHPWLLVVRTAIPSKWVTK